MLFFFGGGEEGEISVINCESSLWGSDSQSRQKEGPFSIHSSRYSSRLVGASLVLVSKSHAEKSVTHVKDPTSNFQSLQICMKSTQIPRNSGKIIKLIMIVTNRNEKSNNRLAGKYTVHESRAGWGGGGVGSERRIYTIGLHESRAGWGVGWRGEKNLHYRPT